MRPVFALPILVAVMRAVLICFSVFRDEPICFMFSLILFVAGRVLPNSRRASRHSWVCFFPANPNVTLGAGDMLYQDESATALNSAINSSSRKSKSAFEKANTISFRLKLCMPYFLRARLIALPDPKYVESTDFLDCPTYRLLLTKLVVTYINPYAFISLFIA